MSRDFIVTKEHRRFVEFANAIRKDTSIGICHGEAGVGKTQSARRYAHWDTLGTFIDEWGHAANRTWTSTRRPTGPGPSSTPLRSNQNTAR
ncbi:hypothetical protein [Corynebacterium variabile]|uniref:hypothetical protein n=1 Tax=Corynebacterium variabile TaxID=1727 RepID=UPI003A919569